MPHDSVDAALARLEAVDAAKRLWAEDATLWSPARHT